MERLPEFSNLSSEEKDVLIQTLLVRLDEAFKRIAALEAENTVLRAENKALREQLNRPPKTPDNSSKPPSQGQKASQGSIPRAKRKPHPGNHRALHPQPTRETPVFAGHCGHCQADLTGIPQEPVHAYDRIEIPKIVPDVTRVILHGGVCPCCNAKFKATPPAGLEPGSPFGPNLRAFVLYLRFGQAIPFERLERLMFDLFGLEISEGALANMLEDSAPAFEKQANRIRERLLSGTALESDETSARVGKKTFWTWVFHHGDSAYFVIRPSRGKLVVEEFLGDARPEFWVSDRLGAQMGWATKEHQVCLAHLLRDIQYAIDSGDTVFAPDLMILLKWAIRVGRRRPELTNATLAVYHSRLQSKLDALLKIEPNGKAAEKLQRIIKKYRQNLFVFVTNRAIPPTNNGSERALRPCVVFRKVTNCFRSVWGADLSASVRSVVETARRRGVRTLDAIRLTLDGMPLPTNP
jgi:transposase